jgi:hypothetical protein
MDSVLSRLRLRHALNEEAWADSVRIDNCVGDIPLFFGDALIGCHISQLVYPSGGVSLLIAEGLGPERGEPGGIGAIEGDLNSWVHRSPDLSAQNGRCVSTLVWR